MKELREKNNELCPQTLFLYGTYKEDKTPNFGLFCWFSYYWDSELGVMACIGGDKLTKDRIRETKVFSANLVTEELLPLADYFGSVEGYESGKMNVDFKTEKGQVLDVPVLSKSPKVFELRVDKEIECDDGTVFLCKIEGVLEDEELSGLSPQESMELIRPVRTTFTTYFGWDGKKIEDWGFSVKK